MKIYAAMSAIMAEAPAIAKDRPGHGYKFRGIDDVYGALNAILAKHKVFTVPKVISHTRETHPSNAGKSLLYSLIEMQYTFFADDGSSVVASTIGEGMDSGDKASNKAMSVAHKYALLQVFSIPTDDAKDPENDNHDLRPYHNPIISAPAPRGGAVLPPGSYVIKMGKTHKGKRLNELDYETLESFGKWLSEQSKLDKLGQETLDAIAVYLDHLDGLKK